MKRNLWKLVSLILVIIIVIFWWFCCNQPNAKDVKLYDLRYSRDSVRVLLNNPDFKKIVLQFYTTDVAKNPENYQLVGYDSARCKMNYLKRRPIGGGNTFPAADTFHVVKDSVRVFSGEAVFGNLELSSRDLYLITHKEDNSEIDYDFIHCRPMKAPNSNNIWYVIYPVKAGRRQPYPPSGEAGEPGMNPRPPED
jgi:hypothetical protein